MAPRNLVLWSSLECSPPCQGGGRGFKSRQDRSEVRRARIPSRDAGPSSCSATTPSLDHPVKAEAAPAAQPQSGTSKSRQDRSCHTDARHPPRTPALSLPVPPDTPRSSPRDAFPHTRVLTALTVPPVPRELRARFACGPRRWRMAASARHETRALLRAHLSAASSYRHLTRHCPICHRLLRLAMDSPRDVHRPHSRPPRRPSRSRPASHPEPATASTRASRTRARPRMTADESHRHRTGDAATRAPLAHVSQEQQGRWHVTGVTA